MKLIYSLPAPPLVPVEDEPDSGPDAHETAKKMTASAMKESRKMAEFFFMFFAPGEGFTEYLPYYILSQIHTKDGQSQPLLISRSDQKVRLYK